MAESPDKNILPQESSTPFKKSVNHIAVSTPKVNATSADCQQIVADFKLFLDELDIDDNRKLDDGAECTLEDTECTLEDELSKLETTLKNIELEYSIHEVLYDSEKDVECCKWEDGFDGANSESSVSSETRKLADVTESENERDKFPVVKVLKRTVSEDASDVQSVQETQENGVKSEVAIEYQNLKEEVNVSKLVLPVSQKTSSEEDFVTLDECGEISDDVCAERLGDDVPSNNPVQESKEKHDYEELNSCKLLSPVSPDTCSSLDDLITLDGSGEIFITPSPSVVESTGDDDSVQIIFDASETLDQNDATVINKSLPDKFCLEKNVKDDGTIPKEVDEAVNLKSEELQGIHSINNVTTSTDNTNLKHEVSLEETDDAISIVAEVKSNNLQTNKECVSALKIDVDTQLHVAKVENVPSKISPVQLSGEEEVKSPRKFLNDVNKENDSTACRSKSVTSELSIEADADLNKENILEKPVVDGITPTGNDSEVIKVRVAEEFISQDPEENRDNNNEKWEELRKLTTNPERYRALRKRWQNISNPDPNKNLTTRRCFRKNFVRKKLTAKLVPKIRRVEELTLDDVDNELARKFRKRKCVGYLHDEPEAKRTKKYPCTILYDEQIAVVTKAMHEELISLDEAQQEALSKLNFLQNVEQENLRYREGCYYRLTPNAQQLRNRQDTETLVALEHFEKKKKKIEGTMQAELAKLKTAADEIYAFHSFYNGITEDNVNTLLLTEEQVRHLRDIETYYHKINLIYESDD